MAPYIDEVLRHDPSWGIIGASLRRSATRDALAPQDFLYTLIVRSGSGTAACIVGSVLEVLDATTQRRELMAAMVDPRTRIVSLTVTEKGYCHDPATGEVDHIIRTSCATSIILRRRSPRRPSSCGHWSCAGRQGLRRSLCYVATTFRKTEKPRRTSSQALPRCGTKTQPSTSPVRSHFRRPWSIGSYPRRPRRTDGSPTR